MLVRASVGACLFCACQLVSAGLFDGAVFSGSGYLRENLALGFEDHPERSAATGRRFGGKGDFLMVRHSLLLEGYADFGWANVGAVTRISREEMTSYLKDLSESSRVTAGLFGGTASRFRDFYD